ncbi:oleate hydratase, partial [Gemmiger formicilis]|nr:oleate hydratase [Gemmiger formicilis]
DSAWLMSWTFNRQPHFKAQPEGQLVGWIYGLYPERPGDHLARVGVPAADLLHIGCDAVIQQGDGGGFPLGGFD